MKKISLPEEARQDSRYREALADLLFQLADDDFLLAFRGSEWLGLAPHIEEDVAFSSISQNTMGHSAMYYTLLEELGEGLADDLAHGRNAEERRNAVLVELKNGTGHYLEEPRYDWAFAVVRNYFYEIYKRIKLESLMRSSYEPLAHIAAKVKMEQYYHELHWSVWFRQLCLAGGEAEGRMAAAIGLVWREFAGVLDYGPFGNAMAECGLALPEEELKAQWEKEMQSVLAGAGMDWQGPCGMASGSGRRGEHTPDLDQALLTLGEVYRSEPNAVW